MSSLSRYLTAKIIAQDVRMRRQVHKGSFVLVEGTTDVKRFRQFFTKETMIIDCHGKQNVVESIEQFYEDGFEGAVGLVDSDFEKIHGGPQQHEGLCYSTNHDFEMDTVFTQALDRYLAEVADSNKILEYDGIGKLREAVAEGIRPLSALRYLNHRGIIKHKLDSIRHHEFFDGQGVDLDALVEQVSKGAFSSSEDKKKLKELVENECKIRAPFGQFTSGHDFCAALGIALQSKVGARKIHQSTRNEVEIHMRLTYSTEDFEESSVKKFCKNWEKVNSGFQLLK